MDMRPEPFEPPAPIPRTVPPSKLEIIRFAAANYLCVDLTYDGTARRIEPYSLRQTAEGNFVLHAIRSDSGEHRSYRVDRMRGAAVTSPVKLTSGPRESARATDPSCAHVCVRHPHARVRSRRRGNARPWMTRS